MIFAWIHNKNILRWFTIFTKKLTM